MYFALSDQARKYILFGIFADCVLMVCMLCL